MQSFHIDRRARSLAVSGSRRGLLGLLAGIPLAGMVAVWLEQETGAAKRQRRKTQRHRDDLRQRLQEERKKKHKKKACAKTGQTPSRKKACCKGLVIDGAGRCASPSTCVGNACTVCANDGECQAASIGNRCCGGSCVSGTCCTNADCADPAAPVCGGAHAC